MSKDKTPAGHVYEARLKIMGKRDGLYILREEPTGQSFTKEGTLVLEFAEMAKLLDQKAAEEDEEAGTE